MRGDARERLNPGPARRPSQMSRGPGLPSSQSQTGLTTLSGTTVNDTVVPNKSTMTEEKIEVPYSQDFRESFVFTGTSEGGFFGSSGDSKAPVHQRQASGSSSVHSRSGGGVGGGLRTGASSRQANERDSYQDHREDLEEEHDDSAPATQRNQSMLSNSYRGSGYSNNSQIPRQTGNASNMSRPTSGVSQHTSDLGSGDIARERKARSEAEAKITGLERRLNALEKEVKQSAEREKWERDRAKELEEEVKGHKERYTNHTKEIWSLQRDLENSRSEAETHKQGLQSGQRDMASQVQHWKDRCTDLENETDYMREELDSAKRNLNENNSAQTIKELQNELINLVEELKAVSARNEELMTEKEQDDELIRTLEEEKAEFKRKWETTRTQLRNLKATSTMFVSKPITDDHMPASVDGKIADVHVTAFQSSIDDLLAVARSSQPTGVLQAMKGVVEAINDISEDVRQYEAEPSEEVDSFRLSECKHQSTATLNALMQAARNHAMSSGLSPISLLDGAASHVSANVVEMIKLLKIRKTVKASASATSLAPSRRSFIEMHQRRSVSSGTGILDKLEVMKDGRSSAAMSVASPDEEMLSPVHGVFPNGLSNGALSPHLRAGRSDSMLSASSMGQQSDAFDLDRKASILTSRNGPSAHTGSGNNGNDAGFHRSSSQLHPSRSQMDSTDERPGSSLSMTRSMTASRPFASPEPTTMNDAHRHHSPSPAKSSPTKSLAASAADGTGLENARRSSTEWEEVKASFSTFAFSVFPIN